MLDPCKECDHIGDAICTPSGCIHPSMDRSGSQPDPTPAEMLAELREWLDEQDKISAAAGPSPEFAITVAMLRAVLGNLGQTSRSEFASDAMKLLADNQIRAAHHVWHERRGR